MRRKRERKGGVLDYAIGILMITILILATFLLPQGYSAVIDKKDINQVHAIDRESFIFKSPVNMTVGDRIQQMMEALESKENIKRTLYLTGQEVANGGELLKGIREAMQIAVQYQLMPDISKYDLENNIIYAEYFNLNDETTQNTEMAFWNIRFSDYETFDFTFRVDASEYIFYQVELYCPEVTEYVTQLMSYDKEVIQYLNQQFMEGCEDWFEAEGYSPMTDDSYGEMVLLLGYERGEYALYRSHCTNGYVDNEGLRWGFVPMTIALEKGNVVKDWGYKGIQGYYRDLFGIEIYEEDIIIK